MSAPLITDADVERAYDVCALVGVCEHALRFLDDAGVEYRQGIVGDCKRVLLIAGNMAGQVVDLLENVEKAQRNAAGTP